MKIYTKKGDNGDTSLFGGQRVRKDHVRIEAYGTVDELNSILGTVISHKPVQKLTEHLVEIQKELFEIGADLATPQEKHTKVVRIKEESVQQLELLIDELDSVLPELTSFILPSGSLAATQLHVARTVCRRAERCVFTAMEYEAINPLILQYLNRLSDLLFVMARFENHQKNIEETRWLPN